MICGATAVKPDQEMGRNESCRILKKYANEQTRKIFVNGHFERRTKKLLQQNRYCIRIITGLVTGLPIRGHMNKRELYYGDYSCR